MKKEQVKNRIWKFGAVRNSNAFVFRLCFVVFFVLAEFAVLGTTLAASQSTVTNSGVYRLMPGDTLGILVFDQKDLSGDFVIDSAGKIVVPLAGAEKVAGLTLEEAQQLIQKRLSDGLLVHPTVSVRVTQYRPIFVTGYVRRPGNYPFISGMSVRAAIATAGGEGEPGQQPTGAVSKEADAILADERVRQLETDHLALFIRKVRLEHQRDGTADFVMPQPVGFDVLSAKFTSVYASENDAFTILVDAYQRQLKVLQDQRPHIQAEIEAVKAQIDDVKQRLTIVSDRAAEYEDYAARGYVRKPVVTDAQIQKSLVQAELSRLQADLAHLRQNMGDLEVRKEEVKANYMRQTLTDLQDTSQRLLEIDATLDTARQLRHLRAREIGFSADEEYTVRVTRTRPDNVVAFNATEDTELEPGDVVEIKHIQNEPSSHWNEAAQEGPVQPKSICTEKAPQTLTSAQTSVSASR